MTNSLRRWTRLFLLGPGLLLVSSAELRAQAIEARVGRFWDSAGWATFRLGIGRQLSGVLGAQLHGDMTRRDGGAGGGFAGVGTDLTLFRKPDGGPYLLAGLSGGLGSETSNAFSDPWGSWSAGVGYDLFPLDFLSIGAEGRWRELSLGGRDGAELALGVSVHINRGIPKGPPRTSVPLSGTGRTELANLADSIVATAAEAMGRPYEYGGTGEDGEGFDCSGLIQYAFGKHGIQLPRRSVDQAREGTKIDKNPEQLRPADLLTFSNRGGAVTHVGLYMGDGRFIHSATRGVQVSTLSPSDPYGRWWYKRWVGVRRIIR